MPILPKTGRRSPGMRLLIALLYVLLTLGSVTMIYPFLLMVATGITSGMDSGEYRVVPRYLYDDHVLFAKYLETKYGGMGLFNGLAQTRYRGVGEVAEDMDMFVAGIPPRGTMTPVRQEAIKARREIFRSQFQRSEAAVRDWIEYLGAMDRRRMQVCFQGWHLIGEGRAAYQEFVRRRCGNDLDRYQEMAKANFAGWRQVSIPSERWFSRDWEPEDSELWRLVFEFKETLPLRMLAPYSMDAVFRDYARTRFEGDEKKAAAELGPSFRGFDSLTLTSHAPAQPALRKLWEGFVRERMPLRDIIVADGARKYREYLRDKYGTLEALNAAHGAPPFPRRYASFDEISVPDRRAGRAGLDWEEMIWDGRLVPVEDLSVVSPEIGFRDAMAAKYGTVEALNAAHGTDFASFDEVSAPLLRAEWIEFLGSKGWFRLHCALRNYTEVLHHIVFHGDSLLNTLILVLASILTSITVNPLCAYALSRFNLSYANKVLLFCLATMAFPAEVTMIPGFLLLRDMDLLNTYWALILPGMANGFSIFLLKGFFDTIPKDLYEAAMLDGCGELRIFFQITLPVSRPVLAYIALTSFVSAYSSFMWALLVCQKQEMWTLMVWLYEMNQWAPIYLRMAALTLAALPTLAAFVLCQKIIMEGIVLPVAH
ncbi:MAG: ABC transporter permease subunit [Planctomycetota bacterium]|nr:ABC transporter permease subunit [Planctomycetota bacterium]